MNRPVQFSFSEVLYAQTVGLAVTASAIALTLSYSVHLNIPVFISSFVAVFIAAWGLLYSRNPLLVSALIIIFGIAFSVVAGISAVESMIIFPVLVHLYLCSLLPLFRFKISRILPLLLLPPLLFQLVTGYIMSLSILLTLGIILMISTMVSNDRRILVAMVSSVLSILFAEGVLRIRTELKGPLERSWLPYYVSPFHDVFFAKHLRSDYWLGYANAEKVMDEPEFKLLRKQNSEGVLDVEHSMSKKDGTVRWLSAGDSFTENCCAPFDSSWTKLVEKAVGSCVPFPFEHINQAFAGSDPVHEFAKFRDLFVQYEPDIVSLSINTSDLSDVMVRGNYAFRYEHADNGYRLKEGPWWETLYAMSFVVRAVVHGPMRLNHLFMTDEEYKQEHSKLVDAFADILKRFKEETTVRDIKFFVIFHPTAAELRNGVFGMQPIIEKATELRIPHINLYERYSQIGVDSSDLNRYYYPIDGHHTGLGNYLWAQSILPDVVNMLGYEACDPLSQARNEDIYGWSRSQTGGAVPTSK
ncbi:hypothetical protein N9J52_01685 [Flavobacteriales bacterium]|nr:hypothetical protein [Flavobacteriales bacterium]